MVSQIKVQLYLESSKIFLLVFRHRTRIATTSITQMISRVKETEITIAEVSVPALLVGGMVVGRSGVGVSRGVPPVGTILTVRVITETIIT